MLLALYFLAADEIWPARTAGITSDGLGNVIFSQKDYYKKLPKPVKKAVKKAAKIKCKDERIEALKVDLLAGEIALLDEYIQCLEVEHDKFITEQIKKELARIENVKRWNQYNDEALVLLLLG